jgi:hypothetical protein
MENGYSGKHGKRGANQIIIVSFASDARVGVTTLKNGIVKLVRLQRMVLVNLVVAPVLKIGKQGSPGSFDCFLSIERGSDYSK